ncbi:unnamed protein product [Protopolystoma xenopodis]|uniref:Uncharacterized protein n=1 Tax=Protopolystoma xenopodis TaxID=117903 RepID=A0A448XQ32_9PLAT|nr:unnamed protein product [Protopolystoma xenopodis]
MKLENFIGFSITLSIKRTSGPLSELETRSCASAETGSVVHLQVILGMCPRFGDCIELRVFSSHTFSCDQRQSIFSWRQGDPEARNYSGVLCRSPPDNFQHQNGRPSRIPDTKNTLS